MKPKAELATRIYYITFLVLSILCLNANALFLPTPPGRGGPIVNQPLSETVVLGGIEWMRWDLTLGLSPRQALDGYSPYGWRIASENEMSNMLNDYLYTNYIHSFPHYMYRRNGSYAAFTGFSSDESAQEHIWDHSSGGAAHSLMSIFGVTDFNYYAGGVSCLEYFDGCITLASALYGSDGNSDNLIKRAELSYTYFDENSYEDISLSADNYSINNGMLPDFGYALTGTGVALVRNVSPVPIPASLPMFGLVMGIYGVYKHSKKKDGKFREPDSD